jgi:hypothetical protein
MPEPVLLTFDRGQFEALHRVAGKGNESALGDLLAPWEPYKDTELECFICGGLVTERPPFVTMLPERDDRSKVIAAPVCTNCHDLPKPVRLHRAFTLLKKCGAAGVKFISPSSRPNGSGEGEVVSYSTALGARKRASRTAQQTAASASMRSQAYGTLTLLSVRATKLEIQNSRRVDGIDPRQAPSRLSGRIMPKGTILIREATYEHLGSVVEHRVC